MCDKRRQSILEEGSLVMGVHLPPWGAKVAPAIWAASHGCGSFTRGITPMIFDFVLDTVTIMNKMKAQRFQPDRVSLACSLKCSSD